MGAEEGPSAALCITVCFPGCPWSNAAARAAPRSKFTGSFVIWLFWSATAKGRKLVFFIYKLEVLCIYFSKGTPRSYFVVLMPWTGGNFHAVHFLDTCTWLTWRKGVLFHFNYVIIYTPPLDWDCRVRRAGKPGEDREIKRFQRFINPLMSGTGHLKHVRDFFLHVVLQEPESSRFLWRFM